MRRLARKLNKFLFLTAIFMIMAFSVFYPGITTASISSPGAAQISSESSLSVADILAKTNAVREENKVDRLTLEEKLQAAAQRKAEDMANNNYFAHTTPSGKTPWQWLNEENYAYQRAGENLAVNFENSSELVQGWMDSPLHKKNLLNGDFEEVGIGVAHGTYEGNDAVYIVEFYATPEKSLSSDVFDRLLAVL
jgi:uncharacterized protein YkwD